MIKIYKANSDEELVAFTLCGDNDAYCELVTRYKDMVFGVALSVIADYHAAEDIAQETFIDGFLQLSRLNEPAKISAWLYGITKRKSLHYITRLKRHEDISEFTEILFTENTSPEDILIKKETSQVVKKALDNLSEKNKTVVELFYLSGIPISEISKQLCLPEGTVKSRLHDARQKLKGELLFMKETNYTLSPDFEKVIKEKIAFMTNYYQMQGNSYEGFDTAYLEVENMIEKMPDSTGKQSTLADLYMLSYRKNTTDPDLTKKARIAAEAGKNADVLCSLYIDEIIKGEDYSGMIKRFDGDAIPKMDELNYPSGKGMLLFWRGRAELRLKHMDLARENFTEAVNLVDKKNIYHAVAVAAIKCVDLMTENADNPYAGFNVIAESYMQKNTKLHFIGQPGFSDDSIMLTHHMFDLLNYHISRFDDVFYDTQMDIGKRYTNKNGDATLTLETFGDTVTVMAGNFENCMRFHYSCPAEYDADIWYADAVGMVKVDFSGHQTREEYELCEYDIKGGSGYMPFCEGNRWKYNKPDLPDYLYQCFENEIDWTDGTKANCTIIRLVAFKKNYLTEYKLDSDLYIARCDKLCDEWKLDEAVDMLRRAVRENSTQNAVVTALAGIDYLTRFKEYQNKGFRFCPSSMNASFLTVKSGSVMYDESGAYAFGPYRWGSRHEENRIFGVKPFRYLQQLFGRIYDEKWVLGYSETKTVESDKISAHLTVTDAGNVTTKAGTFTDCIKVTISSEMESLDPNYYFADFRYTWCGTKEFWFAPGIGIVRFNYTWGKTLKSSSELVSYDIPAAGSEYMSVYIGNRWEYDEVNLTAEGYRAKRIINVACGIDEKYLITDAQEFLYLGTEEEYESFKVTIGKK